MEPGLVSVVVPAFNRERFLAAAVQSALDQTYTRLEVIVVDDGSTDGTPEVARTLALADPRVRVVRRTNGGPASARNTGLEAARGEYVSFLDSDDVYLPGKLASHVKFFEQNPGVDLVFSDHAAVDEELNVQAVDTKGMPPLSFRDVLAIRSWFATVACTVRKSLLQRVGPFRTDVVGPEDWELWLRCAEVGTFSYVPGLVALYRWHADQYHGDYRRLRSGWRTVIDLRLSERPRERRLAMAAVLWNDVMHARLHRRHATMTMALVRFALTARTPSRMKQIVSTINL
jgi:glycosyltransferase involved in cell wall biosynthesis